MVINAMALEFVVVERQRSFAGCAHVNRRIVFVGDSLGENSTHLQAGRILTSRNVLAFDGFIDAFKSANLKRHRACKFLEHTPQMRKIGADKKLRLFCGDVERASLRMDRVGDLLYRWLKARD